MNTNKPTASLAFVFHNLVLYETIAPLLRKCEENGIAYDLYIPVIREEKWDAMYLDTYSVLRNRGVDVKLVEEVPEFIYKMAFYPYLPYYIELQSIYKIRYQYGLAKPDFNLDAWSVGFDYVFSMSTYDHSVLQSYTQSEIVGMIKYANFKEKDKKKKEKYSLLYLPTYGAESSLEIFAELVDELKDKFEVKVKLHHGTTFLEPERKSLMQSKVQSVFDHHTALTDLIQDADIVLSDGSGAVFDALYTNTPIAILKHQPAKTFEGIIPLEEQLISKGIIPLIENVEKMEWVLIDTIENEEMKKLRQKEKEVLFPVRGEDTLLRCLKIIKDLLNDNVDPARKAGLKRLSKNYFWIQSENLRIYDELERIKLSLNDTLTEKKQIQSVVDEKDSRIELLSAKIDRIKSDTNIEIETYAKLIENLTLQIESIAFLNGQKEEQYLNGCKMIENLKKENVNLNAELSKKNLEISHVYGQLNSIYDSKRWIFIEGIKRFVYKTKLIYVTKAMKVWKEYGIKILFKKVKNKIRRTQQNNLSQQVENIDEGKAALNWYGYKFFNFKAALINLNIKNYSTAAEEGLVSIVLPVFNGEAYIEESIKSVLNQSYANFELIIINDGSTDSTKEILERYKNTDQRLKVIHQENKRIPRTLSRGFKEAKGEYFTWTSADNNMHSDFLEKMVNELSEDPEAGMVFANIRLIDAEGKIIQGHGWYENSQKDGTVNLPHSIWELNTYPNNTIGAAFMYRAKVARILGEYSRFKHTLEDYDYWMRMNSLFKLKHVSFEEPIYDYRWHNDSLTSKDQELGITSNRYKLMALDDFRRDFYLNPIVWIVDDSDKELYELLKTDGQIVLSNNEVEMIGNFNLGTPLCYISRNADSLETIKSKIPQTAYKALLTNSKDLDVFSDSKYSWDVIIGVGLEQLVKQEFWCADLKTAIKIVDYKLKNDHLYKIEEEIESEQKFTKKLSVIICTYKRTEKLVNVLKSLISQTMPVELYELIVVNNDYKNVEVKDLVDELFGHVSLFVQYVNAPIKGLSFARNVGMHAASGEVILYLDDDSVADTDLLQETWNSFVDRDDYGVIGGSITLNLPENIPDALRPGTEGYWSQLVIEGDKFRESKFQWEFPYGANFAVRKSALMRIGGFRSSYGRKGNDYAGGEEMVVSFMMNQIGYKVGLNPKMKVLHDVDNSRYTLDHVRKTMRNSVITNYQLQKDLYAPMESDLISDEAHLSILREELEKSQRKLDSNYDRGMEVDIEYKKYAIEAYETLIEIKKNDVQMRKKILEN